jgi:acetyl-CoA/propionyl-CoA carboxylase biotin carboxyl carrier protein
MRRATTEFSLTLDGTIYKIVVDGNSVLVNGHPFVIGFEQDRVLVDGTSYDVVLEPNRAVVGGIAYDLGIQGMEEETAGPRAAAAAVAREGAVTAIMPGKIIRVLIGVGDPVAEGDVVCILEAMKMENELKAPKAGTIKALYVEPGRDVEMGAVLAEIE